jgi:hypothetical protein
LVPLKFEVPGEPAVVSAVTLASIEPSHVVGFGVSPQRFRTERKGNYEVRMTAPLQALTQIQEVTIVFVPKILAIFVSLLIALPFMSNKLHAGMPRIIARISSGA